MDSDLAAAQARINELIIIAKAKEERLHSRRAARVRTESLPATGSRFGGLAGGGALPPGGAGGLDGAFRPARGSPDASLGPDLASPGAACAGGDGMAAVPLMVRRSSSLVTVEAREPNRHPLGQLQLGGRREYDSLRSSCVGGSFSYQSQAARRSTGGGPRAVAALGLGAGAGLPAARGSLAASALPPSVVRAWQAGELSADLALRELLDAVCRAAASGESRQVMSSRIDSLIPNPVA